MSQNQASHPADLAAGAAQALLQAEIRTRYELVSAHEPDRDRDEDSLSSPQRTTRRAQQTAAPFSLSGLRAPDSATALQAPFQLPHVPHPIVITIEQEDRASRTEPSPAAKRWTVKVSLDAGIVGQVDVTIGFCAGAISVRLSSGEAGRLSGWLPELKATLEQADFAVEEICVCKTDPKQDEALR